MRRPQRAEGRRLFMNCITFASRFTGLSLLMTLGATIVGCTDNHESAVTNSGPVPEQSQVQGPFANEPVIAAPTVPTVASSGSNAPLLQGAAGRESAPTANNQGNTDNTDPTNSPPPPPPPPSRDVLIDGLRGEWFTNDARSDRNAGGWTEGGCVLVITSATQAVETCTTRTQYGESEQDSCHETGRLRTRITTNPYTLSVVDGTVHFTPGYPEPVRDDHCNAAPAQRHTVMDSIGWVGTGNTLNVRNSVPGRTNTWNSSYTRRLLEE